MKNITPLHNKLGMIDPDDVITHVASGGSLDDYAKQLDIRFSDLFRYLTSTPELEKKLELANKCAEARDRDLVVRSLRGVIETYPSDMFDDDGQIKPVSEWPKELLTGFEIEEIVGKHGEQAGEIIGRVKKVKTVDRLRAMEMLGKERGMFVNRTKVDASMTLEQMVANSYTKEMKDANPTGSDVTDGLHESAADIHQREGQQ